MDTVRQKKKKSTEKETEPKKKEEDDDDDDEDEEDLERMWSRDAWLFPVIGSVALVGLYMIVKYLGEVWINWLLGWYFAGAGVGSVWNVRRRAITEKSTEKSLSLQSSISLTRYLVGETQWKKYDQWKVSVKKGSRGMHQ
ncbi:hypothetical protein CPB84DRAFT_1770102 [Gymnopilus junonius]|uniref:Uncharacterized protein n=1 Tax=Gymnopilus junonius TaxID=109634 RepID=A0A9P5TR42_GYMJU|nr:hypothetical protein CPB84DRAFT_1770102 [Gymnopilus junonius]